MLKKLLKKIRPNPLDAILKKAKKKNSKNFLLTWNRGLGDIALGLYAIVYRIKEFIPDASITFLVREDLKEGFEFLEDVEVIPVSFWRRKVIFNVDHTLKELNIDKNSFDEIIDNLDPTYWVSWQRSNLIPKLKWNSKYDHLADNFDLPKNKIFIAVQPNIETKYGYWRNWDNEKFEKLFSSLGDHVSVILIGQKTDVKFTSKNIIDLRGKTSLFELISLIKNKCSYLIAPDTGVLSFIYYLNENFPIKVISLFGDSNHGILKQNVLSPNKRLKHVPIIRENQTLKSLSVEDVKKHLFSEDFKNTLSRYNQSDLIEMFFKYPFSQKIKIKQDVDSFELKLLDKQKKDFFNQKSSVKKIMPLEYSETSLLEDEIFGIDILNQNQAGCIILAGGQGSRLGFDGPKGMFKINNNSLFEIFCNKILLKQKKYKTKFHISIMCSFFNHDQIVAFFRENKFFNLQEDQIEFFNQDHLPFLSENGKWIVEDNKLAIGPDGNGGVFKKFYKSGIFAKYKQKNIKYVSIIPIENVLAHPFDEKLLGFHKKNNLDVTIKCIKRKISHEKKGAIGNDNGKVKIVEYLDLDKGSQYKYSNSGVYCINLDFVENIRDIQLDYHFAYKKINFSSNICAYKAESFIFDNFIYANKVKTLLDLEENFYAPIKDGSNLDRISVLLSNTNS